jgi:hypothetical protein
MAVAMTTEKCVCHVAIFLIERFIDKQALRISSTNITRKKATSNEAAFIIVQHVYNICQQNQAPAHTRAKINGRHFKNGNVHEKQLKR